MVDFIRWESLPAIEQNLDATPLYNDFLIRRSGNPDNPYTLFDPIAGDNPAHPNQDLQQQNLGTAVSDGVDITDSRLANILIGYQVVRHPSGAFIARAPRFEGM